VIARPRQLLPVFDDAIKAAATTIYTDHPDRDSMVWKPNLHARLSNLPICPELTRSTLPRADDIGRFLSITGTVIRTSTVKTLEYERTFTCTKCKHSFMVQADLHQYNAIPTPLRCPSEGGSPCDGNKFDVDETGMMTAVQDYQEIKVQEQVSKLEVGKIPRSLWVVLYDDLVDACQPGDDLTVCGVVVRRWAPVRPDIRCELEVIIKANHIRVANARNAGLVITDELKAGFKEFWTEKFKGKDPAHSHRTDL